MVLHLPNYPSYLQIFLFTKLLLFYLFSFYLFIGFEFFFLISFSTIESYYIKFRLQYSKDWSKSESLD